MASFVSENDLKKLRNSKKRQQQEVLGSAKQQFEERQKYKRYKKETGQDEWMLPSLSKRLEKEPKNFPKHHKEKKHKKKKKKSKRKTSSSSSGNEDSTKEQWVEAPQQIMSTNQPVDMHEDFLAGIRTVSAEELRAEKKKKKEEQHGSKHLSTIEQHGQNQKELNPFWKSGGSGLPTSQSTKHVAVQDASWLRRSLVRMQEQSKESGKDIEVIAKERYGSWDTFKSMLNKAEGKEDGKSSTNEKSKRRFMKPSEDIEHIGRSSSRKPLSKHDGSEGWKKKHCYQSMDSKSELHSNLKNKSPSPPKGKISPVVKASPSSRPKIPDCTDNKVENPSSSSASSCSDGKILTEQEKNAISAKIIKAELMGKDELAQKLKKKLEMSRQLEKLETKKPVETADQNVVSDEYSSTDSEDSDGETVVLSRTSKSGQSWPISKSENFGEGSKKMRKKKVKVHSKDGVREKYFDDDDRYTLKDLVAREKSGAAEDQTQVLSRLSSKMFRGVDGENLTLDDMFESQAGLKYSTGQEEARNERQAISNHQRLMRRLEKCKFCFGNSENPKHLVIAIGKVAYLRLPSYRPLQPGHCLIVPLHHCSTGTSLDENVWDEIKRFMQSLQKMFMDNENDGVFLQTCMSLQRSHHFVIECIPLPKELGDMAPIYFKKAIQECDNEWAQNKKLVDTRGSTVKRKIPAGLPYFAVDFGLDGGFAHVIEDETLFPTYFGREVLGGMLDAEPQLWRKPHEERFNEQMKRAIEFEKMWKGYDWTVTELGS